jgi:hypothetical protein
MKNILSIVFLLVALSQTVLGGPSRIEDLRGWSTNGGFVVKWTVPTPSGLTELTNVLVKYSTSPINTLNWNSPSNARIEWLTDPGIPGTEYVAVVTDLLPNTAYYIAIKTQDSDGAWSTVSNLAVVVSGDSTCVVTLAWDANLEPNVVGYKLHYGTAVGVYDAVVDVGNVTQHQLSGVLLYGTLYYFAVSAIDDAGLESGYSNEISYQCGLGR